MVGYWGVSKVDKHALVTLISNMLSQTKGSFVAFVGKAFPKI